MLIEKDRTQNNYNYCLTQWRNFTTLTYKELNNLKEIIKFYSGRDIQSEFCRKINRIYPTKKVICLQTGVIYDSLTDCTNDLNVSLSSIHCAIKRKTKIQKKYDIRKI